MEAGKGVYAKRGLRPIRQRPRLGLPVSHPMRRRISYGKPGGLEDEHKAAILVVRMSVAAVIIVVVMLLKSIDTPTTKWAVDRIREAITYEFDINESLGKLKFVGDYLPKFKEVFSQHQIQNQSEEPEKQGANVQADWPVFAAPAEGKVVCFFGQVYDKKGQKVKSQGIDISSQQQGWVYAAADGKVIAVGEDENSGKYIKVDHGEGWGTLYSQCGETQVQVGDSVKRGDKIGKMGQDAAGGYRLHFEVWHGEQLVDPLELIQQESKVFQ
ncbi:murein DD-endopeptidase MepM/ murein hydrolase activator NlpD [Caldicoprobacter guelmensis]|uniref:M23 family metallopeptidase n=1 Tax=Caldicoprobacter guelmensis TaxID=1170224 RepID=UPI0019577391|nr:M23 family metallopeptidase [Caldicoprobacter guelmensis]MBM7583070.1 murein DD-endopeptidase MepM/ murein hydrolase activator NlpD [Caldicoprobacter guelmensis]